MATVADFLVDFSKEESGGGTRYKQGTYKAKIVAAKPVVSRQQRTPGVMVKFKFLEGKLRGRTLVENLWATPRAFGRYRDLLEAVGKRVPPRAKLGRLARAMLGGVLYIEVVDDEPSDPSYDPKSVVAFRGFYSVDQYEEGEEEDDDYDDDAEDLEDEEDVDDAEDDDEDLDDDEEEDESDEGYDEETLNELSTAKLKSIADELGLDYPSRLGSKAKPKLIKEILAAQDGDEDDEDFEDDEEEEPEPKPRRRSRRAARRSARGRRARKRKPIEEDEDDDDDLDLDDY